MLRRLAHSLATAVNEAASKTTIIRPAVDSAVKSTTANNISLSNTAVKTSGTNPFRMIRSFLAATKSSHDSPSALSASSDRQLQLDHLCKIIISENHEFNINGDIPNDIDLPKLLGLVYALRDASRQSGVRLPAAVYRTAIRASTREWHTLSLQLVEESMMNGIEPDADTLISIIRIFGKTGNVKALEAVQTLLQSIYKYPDGGTAVGNRIESGDTEVREKLLSKIRSIWTELGRQWCLMGDIDRAKTTAQHSNSPRLTSVLMDALIDRKLFAECRLVFRQLLLDGQSPSSRCFATLIRSYQREIVALFGSNTDDILPDFDTNDSPVNVAEKLRLQAMDVLETARKRAELNEAVFTSIINLHITLSQMFPDLYSLQHYHDDFFSQMKQDGFQPTKRIYELLLKAYARRRYPIDNFIQKNDNLEHCLKLRREMIDRTLPLDASCYNALFLACHPGVRRHRLPCNPKLIELEDEMYRLGVLHSRQSLTTFINMSWSSGEYSHCRRVLKRELEQWGYEWVGEGVYRAMLQIGAGSSFESAQKAVDWMRTDDRALCQLTGDSLRMLKVCAERVGAHDLLRKIQ